MQTISAIVPAYNAAATLAACIESLLRQTRRPAEIIVVDDASTDETASIAARFPVRLIRLETNGGPGIARNAGVAAASGEILAFTDSDCIARPDWLERMLSALEHPGVIAVTGGYEGPVRDGFLPRLQHRAIQRRQAGLSGDIESTITSNLVCRATAFREAGGFPLYYRRRDPSRPIWGNEDEELGHLLARAGRVRWVPDAGVRHDFRAGVRAYLRQQAFYAERIIMSHFRFTAMAGSRTNYGRVSGAVHLMAPFGVGLGTLGLAPGLAGCDVSLGWPDTPLEAGDWVDLACSAGAALLGISLLLWLLLPFRALRDFRRRGESLAFRVKAYPLLLAVDVAWLCGVIRGTCLSIGGFIDGNRKHRGASAEADR